MPIQIMSNGKKAAMFVFIKMVNCSLNLFYKFKIESISGHLDRPKMF